MLNKIFTLLFFSLFLLSYKNVSAQPANVDCNFAQNIPLTSGAGCANAFNNTGTDMTINGVSGACPGGNLYCNFFSYVATGTSNTVTVTPGTSGAAQISIASASFGCPDPTGGWSINNCGSPNTVSWNYPAGTVVTIQVCTPNEGTYNVCVSSTTPVPPAGASCGGATPICNNAGFTVSSMPTGGTIVSPDCFFPLSTQQPLYYQFTAANNGTIAWTGNPTSNFTEFDWALYDLDAIGGCPIGAFDATVACNYNYDNESGTNFGMQAGPGACSGEFCDPINAIAGHTYILIIDNYTADNTGFAFTWQGTMLFSPQPAFTASPTAVCGAPQSVSIVNNTLPASGVTYSWNFDDIASGAANTSTATSPPAHNYTNPGSYTISVSATDGGCTNVASQTVNIYPTPTTTFTVTPVACFGDPIHVTYTGSAIAYGSNFTNFNWNLGGGTASNQSGDEFDVTYAAAGNYNITLNSVTDLPPNSCASTAGTGPVVVTVLPNISNTFTSTPPSCSSTSITFTYTPPGALPAGYSYQYQWDFNNDGVIDLANSSNANPTYDYLIAGTYTAELTVQIIGPTPATTVVCENTTTLNIVFTGSATANAGADATITCTTPSATIGAATVAGTTYSWSPTTGLSNAGIANPVATPTATTVYTLTINQSGCTATDNVTVTVNKTPPSAIAGMDIGVNCMITSASLGLLNDPLNTYSWSPAAGLDDPNIALPTATPTTNTTYTLTVTAPNGCTATDDVFVSVDNGPPIAVAGSDATITCTTSSVQLGIFSPADNTYTWAPTTGLSNPNIADPIASPTVTTTYTLTVSNNFNYCTNTDVVTITVNNTPPTANAGSDITLTCGTPTATIGTASVAGNSYSWSPSTGLNVTNIAQPTVNAAGTYTVTVTNTANGCTATDILIVSLDNTPPTANAGSDLTLTCTTPSSTIGATAVAGNTYSWSPSAGLSATNIAQPTVNAAGNYTVTVTNTANGCTASDIVIVSLDNTPPTANAGTDVTLTCTTTSATLGTTAIAGNTYSWSPSTGLSATNITQPTVNAAGNYTVTVTNTANGCTATDIVNVTLDNIAPLADAGADVTIDCTTTSATIGTTAVTGNTYSWSPSTGLSATNIAQPSASQAATYTVTVTNTANGCTATDAVLVTNTATLPVADAGTDLTLTCTTPTATIGSASVVGNSYSWSPTTGLDDPLIAAPTVSAAGTYTVTVTITATGCTASDIIIVSMDNIAPLADAGSDLTLTCTTPTATLGTTAVAGNTYSWSPSTGLSATNIAQPTVNTGGSYTVTVTNTTNGCTAADIVNVTLDNIAPLADAGVDISLDCITPTATIGAASVAGNSYSWSPSTGLNVTNIAQPTVNAAGTYTVTVTNTTNGCTSTDDVTVIDLSSTPIADAGADVTLTCTITSAGIGSGAIAGYTYSWSPSLGLDDATLANPTASPIVATTYTVTITETASGCTATDQVNVVLNTTAPDVDAGPDMILNCTTAATTLFGNSTTPGATYSWSTGDLTSTTIAIAGGPYTLTVTDPSNGCTAQDITNVTEDFVAPVSNAGMDQTLTCTTSSVTLDGSSSTTGMSYSWQDAAGNILGTTETYTTSTAGSYTLVVLNPGNGCSSTDVVDVVSNTTAPTADAGADQTLSCTVANVILDGSNSSGGVTYSWTDASGTEIGVNATLAVNTAGDYYLTVTDALNGCTGFDMVTVTDISAPPTADAGADQTLTCFSPFVTMGPAMPDPTMTYSWSGPNGFVDMTSNPSVSTGGTYILTVTNPVNNCSSTDTVEIIENLVAPVANAGSDMTITCGSPTVTLDGSTNITTLVTYFWNGPTGPWGAEDLTTNVPGTYVLTVYDAFTGCSTSDAVDVSIDTIVPVTTIPDFADVCENNGIINLTGATPAGGSYTIDGLAATTIVPSSLSCGTTHSISYTYTNPVNGCSSTSTDNIYIECVPNAMIVGYPDTLCYDGVNVQLLGLPSGGTFNGNNTTSGGLFSPVSIGTDTITYSVVGTLAGCASSTTIMIEVLPAPAPNFTVDNICVYDTLVVQYTGSSEPELEWSFPGSNYATSTSGDGPFLVTYPAGGYHSVTVVATNEGGCSNDTTINIWVSEYEINTISNTTVSWGTPVTLYTNIAPVTNDSATTVLWTPSTYLDCDSCEQPIATPLTPTTYVVTLTDTMGCQFYDTVTIDIDVDYTIYIPNAVTPNGDGENDVWYVYGNRIREVDMRVYNRWGEKVFESEDLNIGWDGVYKGKDVNAGVYVYVVHVTYVDGKDEYFKGNLTVVR